MSTVFAGPIRRECVRPDAPGPVHVMPEPDPPELRVVLIVMSKAADLIQVSVLLTPIVCQAGSSGELLALQ